MIGRPLEELRDQSAHMISAIVAVSPVVMHPAWWTAAIVGLALGLSREIGEQRPPLTFTKLRSIIANQKFDLVFWTIGGGLAWIVFNHY